MVSGLSTSSSPALPDLSFSDCLKQLCVFFFFMFSVSCSSFLTDLIMLLCFVFYFGNGSCQERISAAAYCITLTLPYLFWEKTAPAPHRCRIWGPHVDIFITFSPLLICFCAPFLAKLLESVLSPSYVHFLSSYSILNHCCQASAHLPGLFCPSPSLGSHLDPSSWYLPSLIASSCSGFWGLALPWFSTCLPALSLSFLLGLLIFL